jgi:myo-inositol-1(or 4)-monophosphatase|tara:strand:+ start:1224 stop:2036 length:813 start_codon:yes stop_codon:yes gene_type:complete
MRLDSPKMNIMYKVCMKASKSLIRDFGELEKLQVSAKGPGDFVSAADKKSEKIIIDELLKAYPDYSILSEEAGEINSDNKDHRWIIDPIDGTLNFLNGIPHFAISIGYEEKGEIISGIIFDPIKNEMFFAEKGAGAFLNNSRIRVSNKKKISDSLLVTGGPKFDSKEKNDILSEYIEISNKINAPIRKFGSASLDMANVACGRFDGYWQWDLKYWDIAAGLIIVKEAGGFVDFIGKNEQSSKKKNILATNSNIHQELSNTLSRKILSKIT